MIIVTAENYVVLHMVDRTKWQNYIGDKEVYTTYEVYTNFPGAHNRPKSWLINAIHDGVVDKVIQLGYSGAKTEIVRAAEAFDLEVLLVV